MYSIPSKQVEWPAADQSNNRFEGFLMYSISLSWKTNFKLFQISSIMNDWIDLPLYPGAVSNDLATGRKCWDRATVSDKTIPCCGCGTVSERSGGHPAIAIRRIPATVAAPFGHRGDWASASDPRQYHPIGKRIPCWFHWRMSRCSRPGFASSSLSVRWRRSNSPAPGTDWRIAELRLGRWSERRNAEEATLWSDSVYPGGSCWWRIGRTGRTKDAALRSLETDEALWHIRIWNLNDGKRPVGFWTGGRESTNSPRHEDYRKRRKYIVLEK